MPESHRVNTLPSSQPILRFPGHEHPDLPLHAGVNGLCRDPDHERALMITPGGGSSLIEFCVDARGLWLHVAEGVRGVHVNGRPIQRLACLHVGDAIHCEGVEMQLADPQPRAPVGSARIGDGPAGRLLLRGHGGRVHGQSIALDRSISVGGDDGLRVEDAGGRIGQLSPWDEGRVRFTAEAGQGSCRLNGWPVQDALLRAGDQLVLSPDCRYLVESPGEEPIAMTVARPRIETDGDVPMRRRWRMPWLLLAAGLIALLLAALFWFGVK